MTQADKARLFLDLHRTERPLVLRAVKIEEQSRLIRLRYSRIVARGITGSGYKQGARGPPELDASTSSLIVENLSSHASRTWPDLALQMTQAGGEQWREQIATDIAD